MAKLSLKLTPIARKEIALILLLLSKQSLDNLKDKESYVGKTKCKLVWLVLNSLILR